MNQQNRAQIDRCCDQIAPKINMTTLWPQLLENGIFNTDDVNIPGWEKNLNHIETIRDILLTIKTRGPFAFEKLLSCLRRTCHSKVADILEGGKSSISNNIVSNNISLIYNDGMQDNSSIEDAFYQNLQISNKPLTIKVRKAKVFFDDPQTFETIGRYPMRSNPRGYVLLITIISYINEKKRNAAEHDAASLKTLFEEMGFEVTAKEDLTGAQIKDAVREFSKRMDFPKVSSCFVIISAHGAEVAGTVGETEIQGIDYNLPGAEKVLCSDIVRFFTSESCPQLCGKPKVFVFQACRGLEKQKIIPRHESDGIATTSDRTYADMVVAHATLPGHTAFRDNVIGSWYIQILCEVFMNYACTMHLQDLFNMVDARLMSLRTTDKQCQTSTVEFIGFNKHCYLHPGLFEDP